VCPDSSWDGVNFPHLKTEIYDGFLFFSFFFNGDILLQVTENLNVSGELHNPKIFSQHKRQSSPLPEHW